MRYLKTWMGVVTGSMAGRYDGYPEEKHEFHDSISSLARSVGQHSGETIYEIREVDRSKLMDAINKERESQRREEKLQKKT